MSMIAEFQGVSPRLLETLKQDTAKIRDILSVPTGFSDGQLDLGRLIPGAAKRALEAMNCGEREEMLNEMKQLAENNPQMATLLQQLSRLLEPPGADIGCSIAEKLREAGFSNDDVLDILNIEKAWHGVHYLLCGQAEPEPTPRGQTILGGCEIGEDLGYGPARFLEPQEVKTISAVLASISADDLRANFDPHKMSAAGIYPSVWERQDEDNLQWLLDAYIEVKDYYGIAAAKGFAMLLYLT